MKFTLSWLKDHLETNASLEEITEKLTLIGLEVEGVENPVETLGNFVTAHVIEAQQHPDADRLRVCKVDTGSEIIQVVCGAPNARAGMKGVFAPVGTHIPGTGIDLKKGVIRGVESNGMLCSEREMQLSDEHDGIIDLPQDTLIGQKAIDIMGMNDPVIEIGITPNRPDCLGVYGIARDLAAAGVGTLKTRNIPPLQGQFQSPIEIDLKFDEAHKHVCPHFVGVYVKGVKNGPSPDWMQKRLRAIGLRPINALVDITNYVSFDQGRPLHVYDGDKINGIIHARMGKTGEEFEALDGKTYKVDETMCVIADESGAIGFGGVMGGQSTSSEEDTVNVFIESAYFDPETTAQTGRKTGILSDARYRFERGIDPEFTVQGAHLAAKLVIDICSGEASQPIIAGDAPERGLVIDFPYSEVKRLTSLDVSAAEIRLILLALGFQLSGHNDTHVAVAPPSWRPDIHGKADLVEEVVRIIGLDKVESTPMIMSRHDAGSLISLSQSRAVYSRRLLASRGMVEVVNWSFIPDEQAKLFGAKEEDLKLANPLSVELSTMRPTLLAGLLMAAGRNTARGYPDLALFEVGQVFKGTGEKDQSVTAAGIRKESAILSGSGRHWRDGKRKVDVFDVKADALAVLSELGVNVESVQIFTDASPWYHPGQSGRIMMGPKLCLAEFGIFHPVTLEKLGIKGHLAGFEIYLDAVPKPRSKGTSKPALSLSPLQPLKRDFAFIMDKDKPASLLLRAARGADKNRISNVEIFDIFEGGSLSENQKSMAIEVTIDQGSTTLRDEEIEALSQKIIAAVEKSTGGALRR